MPFSEYRPTLVQSGFRLERRHILFAFEFCIVLFYHPFNHRYNVYWGQSLWTVLVSATAKTATHCTDDYTSITGSIQSEGIGRIRLFIGNLFEGDNGTASTKCYVFQDINLL